MAKQHGPRPPLPPSLPRPPLHRPRPPLHRPRPGLSAPAPGVLVGLLPHHLHVSCAGLQRHAGASDRSLTANHWPHGRTSPLCLGDSSGGGTQSKPVQQLSALQQEIAELARLLRRDVSVTARQRGWPESTARFEFRKELKRLVSELYVRDNCHPVKASLIMWVQIPLWIILTVSLQNISWLAQDESSKYGGLLEGGMLWFSNLTAPDTTWILPISLGLINLLIVEMFALQRKDMSRMQRFATNFIRLLSLVMVPVAAAVPSAVSLYWVSSSAVGLAQNLALRAPRVRSLLHLPRSPMDSETPYRDLARSFRSRIMDRGGSAETPKTRR
ncbi:cytochrome c oxidase assembly protein COX18, mitochondrial isoform X2 [Petromyzon marinus]|uniref:cytochrome c oxidase assembly protein COX18, mitochondrial isoform X2 n=1 Tax=Petromyzon marinus TaxID=7757 RepID=UPI003F6FA4AA